MNEPKWDGQRWRIRVMQDGKTHSFSCKTPGAKDEKKSRGSTTSGYMAKVRERRR